MVEKKKFFDVELPLIKSHIRLIGYNILELENRVVKLDLTRMLRGKSLEIAFRISVQDSKATGDATKIMLMPFFIRRMMRKSVSYVEESFSAECSDSFLRVKPFLITRKKVTRAVRKALREQARKYIEEYVKEKSKDEVFSSITNNIVQKALSLKLKKVYPLALCEIREIYVEKKKEGVVVEKLGEDKQSPPSPIEKTEEKAEEKQEVKEERS